MDSCPTLRADKKYVSVPGRNNASKKAGVGVSVVFWCVRGGQIFHCCPHPPWITGPHWQIPPGERGILSAHSISLLILDLTVIWLVYCDETTSPTEWRQGTLWWQAYLARFCAQGSLFRVSLEDGVLH